MRVKSIISYRKSFSPCITTEPDSTDDPSGRNVKKMHDSNEADRLLIYNFGKPGKSPTWNYLKALHTFAFVSVNSYYLIVWVLVSYRLKFFMRTYFGLPQKHGMYNNLLGVFGSTVSIAPCVAWFNNQALTAAGDGISHNLLKYLQKQALAEFQTALGVHFCFGTRFCL